MKLAGWRIKSLHCLMVEEHGECEREPAGLLVLRLSEQEPSDGQGVVTGIHLQVAPYLR